MPTRSEAAAFRRAQLAKAEAIRRAESSREHCVAMLIRGARGELRWFEVGL